MTTGPEHEPLDAGEAELARRLRALPGGQPAAELDATILARAHAAAASGRRPVRPWLWGLSSAAVALLAVGLFWRAGLPPEQPAVEAPATRKASADAERRQADVPPAEARQRAVEEAPAAESTMAAPYAAPPPPPPPAPEPAAAGQAARSRLQADQALSGAPALEDGIEAHAKGPAADWLAHIESLQRAGRIEAARAHLRAFRERHPGHAIPEGLRGLLDGER